MSSSGGVTLKIRTGPQAELTFNAVLAGCVPGAVIAVSIGQAALVPGLSIEGSELAAIPGSQPHADVTSAFAAGARYINRGGPHQLMVSWVRSTAILNA